MAGHLFSEDANHKTNAFLNIYDYSDENEIEILYWGLYAEGFKRIADMAVEQVLKSFVERDILIYPIISNYRHYIELRLKEVIKDGNRVLDETERLTAEQMEKLFGGKQGHNLMNLWEHYRRVVVKVCPNGPQKKLNEVRKRIAQFVEVDPFGMAGRYPVDTNGNRSFPKKIDIIGFKNLYECIQEIAELLDGMSTMMGVYWDWQGQLAAEMRFYADNGP